MATLADVVKKRRSSGQSRTGSLLGSLKDKFKESIDPRQFLNQTGVLTALFPSLKAYKAGGDRDTTTNIQKKSIELINSTQSLSNVELDKISINTEIAAKNSLVLPVISRDMNLLRQNMSKFVKILGVKPTNKADAFFKSSKEREKEYETKFSRVKITDKNKLKTADEPEKKSLLESVFGFLGKVITPILSIFGRIADVLSSSMKGAASMLVSPLKKIVASSFGSMISIMTKSAEKIAKIVLDIFNPRNLFNIMTLFFRGAGGPILIAAIAGSGLFWLNERTLAKKGVTKETMDLFKKVQSGDATPEERMKLADLYRNFPDSKSFFEDSQKKKEQRAASTKSHVDLPTGERILRQLNSQDESERNRSREELKTYGVSEEAMKIYVDSRRAGKVKESLPEIQKRLDMARWTNNAGMITPEVASSPTETQTTGGVVQQINPKVMTLDEILESQSTEHVRKGLIKPISSVEPKITAAGQMIADSSMGIKSARSTVAKGETKFVNDSSNQVDIGKSESSVMASVYDLQIIKYFQA